MTKFLLTILSLFLISTSFTQKLIPFEKNGKFGFKNNQGEVVIQPKYDNIMTCEYCSGPIPINMGAVTKIMIENHPDDEFPYTDTVREGGKWTFINDQGIEITDFKFNQVKYFKQGTAEVKINGKWGVINELGVILVDCKYDKFTGDLYTQKGIKYKYWLRGAAKGSKKGYLDFKTGEVIVPFHYDEIKIKYGIAVVKKGSKYGYFDILSKKEIIAPKYDSAEPFMEFGNEDTKVTTVSTNGRVFKIDYYGNEIK